MANYDAELIMVTTPAASGTAVTFIMRGYDGTLLSQVFWNATTLDSTGASYTGPGPLSAIVLFNVV